MFRNQVSTVHMSSTLQNVFVLAKWAPHLLRALSARQTEAQLDCALDLMRRLPPQKIEENLAGLIDLVRFVRRAELRYR